MSNLALLEAQHALYNKLHGDGVLMGMVSAIYDNVSQKGTLPYVVIGDGVNSPVAVEGLQVSDLQLQISVWTEVGGRKPLLTILNRIYALLHLGTLSISGFQQVVLRCVQTETQVAEAGNRLQGTMLVHLVVVE